MDVLPNEDEIKQAADLLVNKYNISTQHLGRLLGTNQTREANALLMRLGTPPTQLNVAERLLRRKGPALFTGKSDAVRKLRYKLLSALPDDEVRQLFEGHKPVGSSITYPSHMKKPLAELKWVPRGPWPRDFVRALDFPEVFAGVRQAGPLPTVDDVHPLGIPPKLVEFQENLKKGMLGVLTRDGDKTRCVVTLPTGGGKTRVAVEAFVDWMQQRFAARQYLLWIAQSEELCEQAISCIRQMWGSREYTSSLRVYRYFGGRDIPIEDLQGGAVVASIQQLYNRIKGGDKALDAILAHTGAMIIDEAHRAVSQMYTALLNRAEDVAGPDLFPICGLTATPGRAGIYGLEETLTLVDRFECNLITPDLGGAYSNNPLLYFREQRYLARPRHRVFRSGREYELTDDEIQQMKLENDLPGGFLKRLAGDRKRNELIVRRLLELPQGTPTLIYACTVDHAHFLADILTETSGRRAAAISSDTPLTIRRGLIQDFKQGKIEFLCNFGVLTTGFDAPKTECIALCRPTTSEVLYEQIVGRGLRGPKFGGTEECLVIDFADNIHRLGGPLAYARFKELWVEEIEE